MILIKYLEDKKPKISRCGIHLTHSCHHHYDHRHNHHHHHYKALVKGWLGEGLQMEVLDMNIIVTVIISTTTIITTPTTRGWLGEESSLKYSLKTSRYGGA